MLPRRPLAAALALVIPRAIAGGGEVGACAPGGVSPGEAKALEDAASMLDERKLPPEALPSNAPTGAATAAAPAEMTGDAAPAHN
jgi:hypothetical protein